MAIDMNESQIHTVEQMLLVLAGTQVVEFRPLGNDKERYALVAPVLERIDYGALKKRIDRGVACSV